MNEQVLEKKTKTKKKKRKTILIYQLCRQRPKVFSVEKIEKR